jgi:hypothetical protein
MHPGGGSYDVLALWSPGAKPIIQLNRNGTLHAGPADKTVATWADAVAANGPHDLVKRLEQASGHEMRRQAPPSTPRTLSYRFISGVLTGLVNSRYEWDARNEFLDSSGDEAELRGYLRAFPAAVETRKSVPRLGIFHEPESHFWALLANEHPIALVSLEGVLFYRNATVNLVTLFEASGRSLETVVGSQLGRLARGAAAAAAHSTAD